MKRLLLTACLALALVPAAAAATSTGTGGSSNPYDVSFTTSSTGAVTARAQFASLKGNGRPSLTLRHLLNPADKLSYDVFCQAYENQAGHWVVEYADFVGAGPITGSAAPGDLSCSAAAGPSGYWLAEFLTTSGKTAVTITTSP